MNQRHTKITQKLARSLVKRGANLYAQDSDGKTPLMVAISSTNTERSHALDKIKPLLKDKASLNVSTRRGGNALHLAVGKGYTKVVSGLLRAGINPNIKDWQGRTALWEAQEDLKMIKLLIKGGVNPNLPDDNGQSFFLGQINVGNSEVALALLKLGANVNAAHAQNGETPLMLAAQLKDHKAALSLTRALIKRGAKVNAKSKYGQTALFEAARSENLKLISLLIKRGAKLNRVSGDGETALLYACRKRKFKSAILLVERGAQVNRVEKHRGLSALFYAVRGGDVKLVTLLLKRKASVNITDKEGNSPIFYASKVEIAQLLIANRADLTIKNKAGKTAAEHVSNPQVKALLSQTQSETP